ncbi:hypothetical protein ONZ51_g13050 [Trametes cubensis]|uniref:Uncharacterized protein n=1 Tax=Trametes cubensis TaxID=1111947 RepID=A0AAD7TEY8_9APHY|nr:hypothetical protein ONZ51_g13050 [Trametes cubensis]
MKFPHTEEVRQWRHTSFKVRLLRDESTSNLDTVANGKASAQPRPCDGHDTPHVKVPLFSPPSSSATREPIIHEKAPTEQAETNATGPDHPIELRPYAGDEPAPTVTHPFEGLVGSQDGFADILTLTADGASENTLVGRSY